MTLDESMNRFRIASRELFNHFFLVADPYNNDGWLLEERFCRVEAVLFEQLVGEPCSLPSVSFYEDCFVKAWLSWRHAFVARDRSGSALQRPS